MHLLVALRSHSLLAIMSRLFLFKNPASTEIYTLSLHDALPISPAPPAAARPAAPVAPGFEEMRGVKVRSEEHTSELQSHSELVCRLLLEKKKRMEFYTV